MSSPYQPEPGCTARQRQLEQQVHDLRQQLKAAEDELGPLRQRVDAFQIGAIEREALLADARDLLEPWGGHGDDWPAIGPAITALIGKLNEALERAQAAESARDQFAAGLPLVCSDDRHEAKVRGLEARLADFHDGEEPYVDEQLLATPAQWIWLWNRATPELRLSTARRIREMSDRIDQQEALHAALGGQIASTAEAQP